MMVGPKTLVPPINTHILFKKNAATSITNAVQQSRINRFCVCFGFCKDDQSHSFYSKYIV